MLGGIESMLDASSAFSRNRLVVANELQILFVINNPEVYKSPNSNTYM